MRAEGRIRVLVASLAAVALMLVGIVVPGGAAANAADGATVTVNPSTVPLVDYLTSGVEVTGSGFPASAEVQVSYNYGVLDTVTSDADGNVSYHMQKWGPAPGTYFVQLMSGTITASASFTIESMGPPAVSVSPESLSQSELADSGITITGENYYPNASADLSIDGEYRSSIPSESDGSIEGVRTFTDLDPGLHTLQLSSFGSGSAEATFTVTADPVVEPSVTVDPSTVSLVDFLDAGVQVTGTGFPASAPVDVSYFLGDVVGTVNADADGTVRYTLSQWGAYPGTRDVTLTSGAVSASAPLTIEAPASRAAVTPESVTQSELADPGITITGENFYPSALVGISLDGDYHHSAVSDPAGSIEDVMALPDLAPGTHTLQLSDGVIPEAEATFTVTADPVYDPSVTVSPESISPAEFWNSGVHVKGAGFPPNTVVAVTLGGVDQGGVYADLEGNVAYIVSAQVSPGTQTVTLTAGDVSASAEFTISEPSVTVTPDSVSEAELASSGITITGSGFYPDLDLLVGVDGEAFGSVVPEADGSFSVKRATLPVDLLGEHTLEVGDEPGVLSAQTTFTVTKTTVAVDPTVVTIPELADAGVAVSGTGWPRDGAAVDVLLDGEPVGTASSDADGNIAYPSLTADGVAPGTHEVTLTTGDWSETAELTVSAPAVSVEPETVTLPDFVGTGVQVTGSGFPAQAPVEVSFAAEGVGTVESDTAGNVAYTLSERGTVPGEYEVTLTSGELRASTSLTIEASGPTSVTVEPETVTPAQLADPGITVTGENFSPGALVAISVDGTQEAEATADEIGVVDTVLALPDYVPGEYTVTADDGILPAAETTLIVTPDPQVSLDPSSVTVSGLEETGVVVSGTVFPVSAPVEIRLDDEPVDTVESDAAGDVSYTLMQTDAAPGAHQVSLVSGDWTAAATLEVYQPAVTVSPETLTVSEFATDGVIVTGTGFPALAPADVLFDGEPIADSAVAAMADETTDADGDLEVTLTREDVTVGDHEITVRAGGIDASARVTVEADPVYDPSVSLSPEELSSVDLRDDGVEVTGTGYPADTDVTITIDGEPTGTATTDDAGTVTHRLESIELEPGTYLVGVSADDLYAEATLTVTAVPSPSPDPDPSPDPSPAPAPSPEPPSASPAPTGQLPATGSDGTAATAWSISALMLILAGVGLIAWRRRSLS